MDSPIDPHQLTAFYPSAVRSMAAAAQMSHYSAHGQTSAGQGAGGHLSTGAGNSSGASGSSAPYASIFAAAAAAASAVSPGDPFVGAPLRSRLEVRDLRSAMLHHYQHQHQHQHQHQQNQHHQQQQHQSAGHFHPVSSSAFLVDRPPLNSFISKGGSVKMSSETGSLSPSTDGGDSIAEPLMCNQDSPGPSDHEIKATSYNGHMFDGPLTVSPSKLSGKSDLIDQTTDCTGSTGVASKKARMSKSVSIRATSLFACLASCCPVRYLCFSCYLAVSLHPTSNTRNILMHIHPVRSMYV